MIRPTFIAAAVLGLAGPVMLPAAAPGAITGATLLPIAGTGLSCGAGTNPCGDGGPASAAQLDNPKGTAVLPGGAIIFADMNTNRIRRVGTDGTITTVAGTGVSGFDASGTATSVRLNAPQAVAAIDEDSFLIADTGNHAIRRVDGTTLTTVAGTGVPGFSGDGSGASAAELNTPRDVATRDGGATFLIADFGNQRVRRVAGGIITTVAGSGGFCTSSADQCGDGGASSQADLSGPSGISVLPGDGFLIAEPIISRIRRVDRDDGSGTITRAAGRQASDGAGYGGDGGPATDAAIHAADDVAALPGGGFAIADTINHRVRLVDAAGVIDTAAGDGKACTPPGSACGDGGPAASGQLSDPRGVAVDGQGDLVVGDSTNNRIRRVDLPAAVSPPTAPPPEDGTAAAPEIGRTVLVQTLRGRVLVRVPGSRTYVALDRVRLVPDGSVVDTRRGAARLTVARPDGRVETADLSEGILRIDQRGDGSLVDIRLAEQIDGCPAPVRDPGAAGAQDGVTTVSRKRRRGRSAGAPLGPATSPLALSASARVAARKRKPRTRRGRVKADGRFRTDGRYGSAVVRGTQWLMIDDCRRGRRAQTRVIVREGRVGVRDFARARTTLVREGQRYVAYARRG